MSSLEKGKAVEHSLPNQIPIHSKEIRGPQDTLVLQPASSPRLRIQKDAAAVMYSTIYDWQTRILLLKPGILGEPLVADMHVVDLLHGPGIVLNTAEPPRRIDYNALSYCWGIPDFQKDILCNRVSYPITQNLFDGLKHIRLRDHTMAIWVDALCINQHDAAEKSMQIPNILTIFSKAKHVVAWLGNGNLFTAYALKILRENGRTEDGHSQKCLQEVLQNPWFRRIWVKQEVFAAQRLYVQFGEEVLSWEKLEEYAPASLVRGTPDIKAKLIEGEKRNAWLERRIGRRLYETDIINVLRRTSESEATDPRDFIYGVLGMSTTALIASDTCQDGAVLPVDYAKSVSNIFQDVARYVMKRDGCLNILLLDGNFGATIYKDRLPSWIPDFRHLPQELEWLQYSRDLHSALKCFGIDPLMDRACPYIEDYEAGTLALRGYVLAYVAGESLQAPYGACYVLAENEEVHSLLKVSAIEIQASCNHRVTVDQIYAQLRRDVTNRLILHDEYGVDRSSENPTLRVKLQGSRIPEEDAKDFAYSLVVSPSMIVHKDIRVSARIYDYTSAQFWDPLDRIQNTKYVDTYAKTDLLRGLSLTPELRSRLMKAFDEKLACFDYYEKKLRWLLAQPSEQWKPETWLVPTIARKGDAVLFLKGGLLPLVVRPVPGSLKYQFIGPAIMTGKEKEDESDLETFQWYTLVRYTIWCCLLQIHEEDNRLETFRLI